MSEGDRKVTLGPREVNFPSDYLQQLEDCNYAIDKPDLLRQILDQKGYLFIRGLHDREEVLNARRAVLQYVDTNATIRLLSADTGHLDARCGGGCIPFMEVRDRENMSEDSGHITIEHIGINSKQFTGAHVDNVYMGRGTQNLYTMWTPFGDTTVEMGTLAVCEGSNQLPGFRRFQETYGELDIEKEDMEGTGWFTEDPFEITSKFGGQWKTSDFKAGDVLIFTMRTVHMSTTNITNFLRISCDTRWQPADEVADTRYVGDVGVTKPKYGLFGKETLAKKLTIADFKEKWKL
ncbi:hypothetical protein FSP39_019089 [Pinctada imbricata]|uniref:Phytanoyl-CoA dioxygenase n=1 Tax=Pinctada imbricata TaxID=66713 RepID=A0AA88Y5A9_PINIB|nr:hypothetical protein FSP39_019089 [Pinctada imbricata]